MITSYVSSRGIPFMPVMYQVVGFWRGDGRHLSSLHSVTYSSIHLLWYAYGLSIQAL